MTKQKKPNQIESADRLELLAIRNRLRLTQAGMASALSVSTSLLEKYERGTRRLPADRMARIRELEAVAKPLASEHEAQVASHSIEQQGQLRYDRTMSAIGTVFSRGRIHLLCRNVFAGADAYATSDRPKCNQRLAPRSSVLLWAWRSGDESVWAIRPENGAAKDRPTEAGQLLRLQGDGRHFR